MKFSICIPNYNYARFLGRTIESVRTQSHSDLEILISDNASTDDSLDVVRSFQDERIRWTRNRTNVGFAANLDRAAAGANGEFQILLSSDDLMRPEALAAYAALIEAARPRNERFLICSSCEIVNEHDVVTDRWDLPRHNLWLESDCDAELSQRLGSDVFRVPAAELLRRSLRTMQNPFYFCATAYPRAMYEEIEGYGGARLINPDKWFHWRLLGAADCAYFVRRPLFAYRIHSQNQAAQQSQSKALKFLIDEYAATFELPESILTKARLSRQEFESAFIEYDVVRHGLSLLAQGQRLSAGRTYAWGRAAYPQLLRRNPRAWVFSLLLLAGPLGSLIARYLRSRHSATGKSSSL